MSFENTNFHIILSSIYGVGFILSENTFFLILLLLGSLVHIFMAVKSLEMDKRYNHRVIKWQSDIIRHFDRRFMRIEEMIGENGDKKRKK